MIFILLFCCSILAYTFLIYPVLIILLGRFFGKPLKKDYDYLPGVSVILVVRNAEPFIESKIQNLLGSNYPKNLFEIIVVSDGSTDQTCAMIKAMNMPCVQLLERTNQTGKAACINAALKKTSGDVLVFTDARQQFTTQTIKQLVANLANPSTGAVSGALTIAPSQHLTGSGLGLYWRLEKYVRFAESNFDSAIGCTGAVYAMRRSCVAPIPDDTILDDVVLPMQAALAGFRVLFDPQAKAFDPMPQVPAIENRRKERTLAGNFQMMLRYPAWLMPNKNRLWWQLVSHKYLRLLSPFLLLLIFILNAALLKSPLLIALFGTQIVCYALAMIGWLLPKSRLLMLAAPSAFLFLNVMILRGLWRHFNGHYKDGWRSTS